MPPLDDSLARWTAAGLLEPEAAARIRAFEEERAQHAGMRWQAVLALILGAILLVAGICLFVAAHWDEVAPLSRFLLVLAGLVVLHTGALLVRDRFPHMATALHGVGTAAAGAAIFLTGQIFNIQEHWPAGILLWLLCALAGCALLRDQVQEMLAWLLAPSWLISEWCVRSDGYRGSEITAERIALVIAALYLSAFLGSRKKLVAGVLFAVGAVTALYCLVTLSDAQFVWRNWAEDAAMPWSLRITGWTLIGILPLLLAYRLRRSSIVYVAAAILTAFVVPHLFIRVHQAGPLTPGGYYDYMRMSMASYIWAALLAAFTAWWGLRERSSALLTYGVVCFGLSVLWFYSSEVMNKLDRSFSLMGLGILFVVGGWLLEKTRRRLVRSMRREELA
jgi:uncharacterized membrane protein